MSGCDNWHDRPSKRDEVVTCLSIRILFVAADSLIEAVDRLRENIWIEILLRNVTHSTS